jgi:hypothetical protein
VDADPCARQPAANSPRSSKEKKNHAMRIRRDSRIRDKLKPGASADNRSPYTSTLDEKETGQKHGRSHAQYVHRFL